MSEMKKAFQCLRCGSCCTGLSGYVWIRIEEAERIAKSLSLTLDIFAKRYLRRVASRFSLLEKPSGECIFYEKEKGCMIYEDRPHQCRVFPTHLEKYAFSTKMIEECVGLKDSLGSS